MPTPSIESKPHTPAPSATPSTNTGWLLQHAQDLNTQHGEDGIFERILDILNIKATPDTPCWVVEFGAWDGVHLSNAKNLIDNHNFHALMIEGDPKRCAQINPNYPGNTKVHALNAFVGFTPTDGLDAILAKHNIPKDFDIVSIDIDGNDYHVWEAMHTYQPKVVCIEFNPTIPTDVDFVQPKDPKLSQGAAPKSLIDLARTKGYELICVTQSNLFFVRDQDYPAFNIQDNSLRTLRQDTTLVTHIFSGYDGTIFLDGFARCPWNGMRIDRRKVQQIPKTLRSFPGSYSIWQKALFKAFRYLPGFLRRRLT